MRVLHLITAFQLGGAEKVAVDVCRGLSRRGYECLIAAVLTCKERYGRVLRSMTANAGLQFAELGFCSQYAGGVTAPFALRQMIRSFRPDIVHSHTDFPDFILALTVGMLDESEKKTVRIVRTIHNTVLWPSYRPLARRVEASFIDDGIIAVSRGAERAYVSLRNEFGLPVSKYRTVIYNGISDEVFLAAPGNVCDKPETSPGTDDRVRLCFAGRLVYQKGIDVLIDAIGLLSDSLKNRMELFVFGSGSLLPLLKHGIRRGLPIRIMQPVNGLSGCFRDFEYVVVPSRYEGLGMVCVEAMATGIPCIVTRIPGLSEVMPTGWPLAVTAGNAYKLSELLAKVIERKIDRDRLAELGQQYVLKRFALDDKIESYDRFYQTVAA